MDSLVPNKLLNSNSANFFFCCNCLRIQEKVQHLRSHNDNLLWHWLKITEAETMRFPSTKFRMIISS